MPNDTAMHELCELIVDCPHSTPKWTDAGVLVLRSHNIRGGRLNLSDKSFTDEATYRVRSRRAELQSRDLVITREAPMGEVCMVPNGLRCCLGQRMVLLRPDESKCDAAYLLYAIQAPLVQNQISWSEGTGSTVSNLRIPHLEALRVPTPSLDNQRAISAVLGYLDDKIEQNRRTGRKLEELARAVFKAWFVDFEPVKAKAAGATAFPGMPPETFATLPNTLKDSPLGPVPQGWEISLLGDEIRIVKGRSYKSTELQESRTALVTLKSIERGGGYRPDGLKPYVGVYKPDQILNAGDLVIAFTDLTQDAAVVGKPAIVRRDERFDILVASLDLGIVRPCGRLGIAYLYCLCKTEDFQRHVYGHTNGSTVLHLGKVGVPTYPIALPNTSTLSAFDMFAAPLFDMMFASEAESVKLATLRDYLLPRLLSGKVRVRG